MTELAFGPHLVRCDPEATRLALVANPLPERCGCRDCMNFIAARHIVYAEPVAALLWQLGIAPGEEGESLRRHQLPNGLHRYEVWMHFAGEILTAFDANPFPVTEHVSRWCSRFATGSLPKSLSAGPVAQVSLVADLPWLIGEPHPEY